MGDVQRAAGCASGVPRPAAAIGGGGLPMEPATRRDVAYTVELRRPALGNHTLRKLVTPYLVGWGGLRLAGPYAAEAC